MTPDSTRRQVGRVLIITLLLNLSVAVAKIVLGMVSGALAITADGFHSLVDGTSNVVALIANRIAAQPPDSSHPYGHRRFETLAALLIGVFLILTAWEIGMGALDRLRGEPSEVDLSPLTFVVLLATLSVNIGVSTYQIRAGRRLESELLLADAQHTRSDVYVTISVIFSSALVLLTGWAWLDTVVALVVVVLIVRVAWRILWETGSVLVDTAPYKPERLAALVQTVPGVQDVLRARSRGTADNPLIDIDVQVASHMTTAQTAAIAEAVRTKLTDRLPGVSEIEVHFMPQDPKSDTRNYALIARAVADRFGFSTHEVATTQADGRSLLEMHVEVPASQSLDDAHELVTQLEGELAQELPEIDEVITHIEPLRAEEAGSDAVAPLDSASIRRRALHVLRERYPQIHWHQPRLYGEDDALALSLHAAFHAEVSVRDAHTLAEEAETLLRAAIPELTRVTIHTEPYDHA